MKVLVACEFSGIVRDAFIRKGHDALSCDLLPSESSFGPHYQGDVRDLLTDVWDLMICHPPCTYLCTSGNRWNKENPERKILVEQAVDFAKTLYSAPIPKICLENPRSILSTRLIRHTQIIHPWMFGHMEKKETFLWLKNLPLLRETNNVYNKMLKLPLNKQEKCHNLPPTKDRWKERSRTYTGVAEAMADRWG